MTRGLLNHIGFFLLGLVSCVAPSDIPTIRGGELFPGASPLETLSPTAPIPISGGLIGEIPRVFSNWQYVQQGTVTFLVHTPEGQAPDAWVWFHRMGMISRATPSPPFAHFLLTIDPELAGMDRLSLSAQQWLGSVFTDVPREGTFQGEMKELEKQPWLSILTPTLGGGLGYMSQLDSFTGINWAGRNQNQVMIRAGKTLGRASGEEWPGQERMELLKKNLNRLSQSNSDFTDVLLSLRRELEDLSPSTVKGLAYPNGSAEMTFGVVETSTGVGAHFAAVCLLRPTCRVQKDLAHLFDTLKPGTMPAPTNDGALTTLSQKVGIQWASIAKVNAFRELVRKIEIIAEKIDAADDATSE